MGTKKSHILKNEKEITQIVTPNKIRTNYTVVVNLKLLYYQTVSTNPAVPLITSYTDLLSIKG